MIKCHRYLPQIAFTHSSHPKPKQTYLAQYDHCSYDRTMNSDFTIISPIVLMVSHAEHDPS